MGQTIGIVAFFGAIAFGFAAIVQTVMERRIVYRALRRGKTATIAPTDIRGQELAPPFFQRVALPVLHTIGRATRRFTPVGVVERLERELVLAGSPRGWDGERLLAMKFVGVGSGPLFTVLAFARSIAPPRAIFLGVFTSVIGWYLPEWIVRSRGEKRQATIQRALPDALDLLSITVEAGLAFDAAVSRVAAQSGGALGSELRRFLAEVQIGRARSDALRDLGDRSDVPELKTFTLAMVQAEVFGISIAKVLNSQAREMRVKRRQRAEEKAQKLQVKILLPLLGCIFPALFVVLLGPAAISIYQTMLKK